MSNYLAYIDESGDPIFGDHSSKTLFLGAVIVKEEFLQDTSQIIKGIKEKFHLSELKSNRITDFNKRYAICKEIVKLKLEVLTIYVDKKQLYGEWFKRRQSFYKYIQRLLNYELYRLFGSVKVTIDRYGSQNYQNSLIKYLETKIQGELFEPDIMIGSAKESDFIQISDFLSGSLRKALDGDFTEGDKLLDLIKPIWSVRKKIPDDGCHVNDIPTENVNIALIACMDEAKRYLEKSKGMDHDPKVMTLEYLYYSAVDGLNEYVYTQEILGWLDTIGLRLSEEQFRNEVTASLRDEGLIIVGTRKGIKIPKTAEDFQEYISFNVNLALPVLKRLKKAIVFVSTKTNLTNAETLLSDEMQRILNQVDV